MPNWCNCTLEIRGPADTAKEVVAAVKSDDHVLDFNKVVPYPEEFRKKDEEGRKKRKLEEKMTPKERAAHWKKHGHFKDGFNSGGYEWCIAHWGTKWNVYDADVSDIKGGFLIRFDTAWAPPEPVIEKLSEMFPKVTLTLKYEEPGCGFGGTVKFKGGKVKTRKERVYS